MFHTAVRLKSCINLPSSPIRKGRGFLAVILNRLPGVLGFRGIYTYEPYRFTIAQYDGITVNYPGAYKGLGMRTGWRKEQKKQGKK
jgi:hypothetical protein